MAKYQKGQSGNPKGKPKGALSRNTLAARKLLDGELEEITRAAIDKAKAGDLFAIKLIWERSLPKPQGRMVSLKLPEIQEACDLPKALDAIFKAVAAGELTSSEARDLAAVVEAAGKALQVVDLEARILALEEAIKAKMGSASP